MNHNYNAMPYTVSSNHNLVYNILDTVSTHVFIMLTTCSQSNPLYNGDYIVFDGSIYMRQYL